ncbi:pyrimidine reductase family protein [Arthrobacter sp. H41]|uniref:pyrimidine reductase family protein n=1 Tax=Arthrobacter sp. H41 TaxID=1312978 RepID=UPI00047EA213|nr:pyrimidine reductase family protein [Arthrobacter sp. H41]
MITALLPGGSGALTDADLLRLYAYPDDADSGSADPGCADPGAQHPYVRFNFVAAADGSATSNGLSSGLGNDGDKRIFNLLRRLPDIILVGAGTIRAEGYEGALVDDEGQAWRRGQGLPAHPALGIISGSLDLDPSSGFFANAPVKPLIFTSDSAPASRLDALSHVADVVPCGAESVETGLLLKALAQRALPRVLCEGGPAVLGALTASDAVDDLCLSLSPLLAGGEGPRISAGKAPAGPVALSLASLLTEDSALYIRYVKART